MMIFRIVTFIFSIFPFFLTSQTESIYLKRAEHALENNNFQEAVNFVSKAIELDPSNALYYEKRGKIISGLEVENKQLIHINSQSFKKALFDFNKALELEPDNADFYQSRGVLYLNFRKYTEALDDFEQELKLAKYADQKISAMGRRAKAKFKAKEIDASFKILEDALKIDSFNIFILNNLAIQYLVLEDFETARKYLNIALEVDSENKVTLANMGFIALKSGKFEQALDIFNLAIEKFPDLSMLYNNRGFVKYKFGQFQEALNDINYSIELSPANSYAYKNRALIYLSTNQKEKACEDLLTAKSQGYTLDYDNEVILLLIDHCLEVNKKISSKD